MSQDVFDLPSKGEGIVRPGAIIATIPKPPVDALPLVDWLRPALDLPLIEISVDVVLRRRRPHANLRASTGGGQVASR